jgi:hypothetical protein
MSTSFRIGEYSEREPHASRAFFVGEVLGKVEPATFATLLELFSDCPEVAQLNDPKLVGVRTKIKSWALRWHLTDEWCIDIGLSVLLIVRHCFSLVTRHFGAVANSPEDSALTLSFHDIVKLDGWLAEQARDGAVPSFHKDLTTGLVQASFPFEHPAWDPTMDTRTEFEKSAKDLFQKSLGAYCDLVEAAAIDQGLRKTRSKRTPEHYRWLARFQVKGESPADIWRSLPTGDSRSRRAVEKAIQEAARDIGLTLREDMRTSGRQA